jgi:ribose transport system substrate-binding protein
MAACTQTPEPAPTPAPTPSESTPTDNAPTAETADNEGLRFGFNIPFKSHEWYANTQKGAEMTAAEFGWELLVTDCNNNQDTQITQLEANLAQQVDGLIFAPVDGKGVMPLIDQAKAQGVPVITHAVVADWQDAYIGTPDWAAGVELGTKAAQYALDNNLPTPKCLLVGIPMIPACIDRSEGYKEGMLALIPDATFVDVDGGGNKDTAMPAASDALTANPDINNIMGINDDSALGGMQAYDALGYDMDNLVVWGFGCEGIAAKNAIMDDSNPFMGSLAMFPEYFGRMTVIAARDVIAGTMPVNEWLRLPVLTLTKENVNDFY